MWSQKYLVIDKPFFRKSSRMYLCTLHSRKWWMDDANTEQMVGGIRLRIKISQWMCALILHNFVQFFTLQFGQRYVSSHLLYTWMWTLVSKSKQPCFALHEIISFPEKPWSFRSIILDFKKKKSNNSYQIQSYSSCMAFWSMELGSAQVLLCMWMCHHDLL